MRNSGSSSRQLVLSESAIRARCGSGSFVSFSRSDPYEKRFTNSGRLFLTLPTSQLTGHAFISSAG